MRLLYHKNNKDTPFADCRKFRYLSGSKGVSLYYDVTKVLEAISVCHAYAFNGRLAVFIGTDGVDGEPF